MKKGLSLALVVLISNLAIIVGAVLFRWGPLTVVVLFVLDAFLGAVRISIERLFPEKPRNGDQLPTYSIAPMTPTYQQVIYESLLEKRGSIRFHERIPPIYPRNIPDALHCWLFITILGFLVSITWFGVSPIAGSLDVSLGLVLFLIIAKHLSIIAIWTSSDRYEQASALTIRRPRELLLSGALVLFAVVFIGTQPPDNSAAAAATVVLVPKLLFDFREAGIGPGLLTFDSSSDAVDDLISTPMGEPVRVFRTDAQEVQSATMFWTLVHLFVPGIGIIAIFGVGAFIFDSPLIGLGGVGVTLLVALSMDYAAMKLAHGNLEYRVYDDGLVAYDLFLDEPQWFIPMEELENIITRTKPFLLRLFPNTSLSAEIENKNGIDFQLKYLDQPEEFVRMVRGKIDKRVRNS